MRGRRPWSPTTGIATGHADLGGRAAKSTYGVAKAVGLRGVRALDCSGSGSTSGIIAALDWVRAHAVKPAVANLNRLLYKAGL